MLIYLKKTFYQNKNFNSDNPTKAIWQTVNLNHIKKKTQTKLPLSNIILVNPFDVANAFCEYFSSGINEKLNYFPSSQIKIKENITSIYMAPIELHDIRETIKLLNKNFLKKMEPTSNALKSIK